MTCLNDLLQGRDGKAKGLCGKGGQEVALS